ncbi:MAG: hypothetical protein HY000_24580 [Planctomycetes bacterium]|nr:hypothetical protein [Planctomycetota bacterium]
MTDSLKSRRYDRVRRSVADNARRRLGVEALERRELLLVRASIDYSFDTNNFFNTPEKRDLMQSAADTVVGRFADDLGAIVPGSGNTWTAMFWAPGSGLVAGVPNRTIAANEVVFYAGGRDLGTEALGEGGPG